MSESNIRLDDHSLVELMLAYQLTDSITDTLNTVYGDKWGDISVLGSIWRDLYEVLELHVGEDNVEEEVKKRLLSVSWDSQYIQEKPTKNAPKTMQQRPVKSKHFFRLDNPVATGYIYTLFLKENPFIEIISVNTPSADSILLTYYEPHETKEQ